jgi:hypothetical protein
MDILPFATGRLNLYSIKINISFDTNNYLNIINYVNYVHSQYSVY